MHGRGDAELQGAAVCVIATTRALRNLKEYQQELWVWRRNGRVIFNFLAQH